MPYVAMPIRTFIHAASVSNVSLYQRNVLFETIIPERGEFDKSISKYLSNFLSAAPKTGRLFWVKGRSFFRANEMAQFLLL